jgi:hypothetical protein
MTHFSQRKKNIKEIFFVKCEMFFVNCEMFFFVSFFLLKCETFKHSTDCTGCDFGHLRSSSLTLAHDECEVRHHLLDTAVLEAVAGRSRVFRRPCSRSLPSPSLVETAVLKAESRARGRRRPFSRPSPAVLEFFAGSARGRRRTLAHDECEVRHHLLWPRRRA